ncbi:hypothetical protein BT69DRAFT_111542 [Atractiella rhizophila]|nr:hypothetical protein BT69DRAFT_111542 [Atractiella rhizophila]
MTSYPYSNGRSDDDGLYRTTSNGPYSPYDSSSYNTSRPVSQIEDLYSAIDDSLAEVSSSNTTPSRSSEIYNYYSSSPPKGALQPTTTNPTTPRSHARSNSNLSSRPLPLPANPAAGRTPSPSGNLYSSNVTSASNNLLSQMGSSIRPLPQVPADDGMFWKMPTPTTSSASGSRRTTGNSYPPIDTSESP